MSARFCDGFDHYTAANVLQKWTAGAIGSLVTGLTGVGQAVRMTTSASLTKTLDNQASWVIGFRFRANTSQGSTQALVQFFDAGTPQVELRIGVDGTLSVTRNGTAVTGGLSSNALAIGTVYYVEMKVTIADSIVANSCKVRVNGVDWITVATGQDLKNTANATVNSIKINSVVSTLDFDDLYILDGTDGTATQGAPLNDFLGDVAVRSIYPNLAGSNTTWSPSTSTNVSCVSETLDDGNTSYVETSTVNNVDSYAFADITGTQPVQFVQTCLTARKTDVGSRSVAAVCKSGATTDVGATVSLADTFLALTEIRGKDPGTGASWGVTGFNAAEFGVKLIS